MADPVISARGLCKRFRRRPRRGLSEAVGDYVRTALRRGSASGSADHWALSDVSFDVAAGEAFGIVGPNGAGKSTLLKLMAGILRPTSGALTVHGRVSALIELGAGFHPDLTGRENIFLNAAVLGLSRATVQRHFDEIADFAGVREFLDMPLKHYSSGMHARLGFAIAAHAEPDVLLVDEVLSVGDRVFRARCMDRMREFRRRGTAIVLVSHDLGAIASFCDRGLVLRGGRTAFCGQALEALAAYHGMLPAERPHEPSEAESALHVASARLSTTDGQAARCFSPGQRIVLELVVRRAPELATCQLSLLLRRANDRAAVFAQAASERTAPHSESTGSAVRLRCEWELNLLPAEYIVSVELRDPRDDRLRASVECAAKLMVVGPMVAGGIVHLAQDVEVLPTRRPPPIPHATAALHVPATLSA